MNCIDERYARAQGAGRMDGSERVVTYLWDTEQRAPYAQKAMVFVDRITDTLSKR